MITCCELALYIAISAFIVILSLLAMFFNYNLKLDARTVKLEKKNGKELAEIEKLRKEMARLIKTPPRKKRRDA
jgi:hypothetical protein